MKELHPKISLNESSLPLGIWCGYYYHLGVFGIRHGTSSASEAIAVDMRKETVYAGSQTTLQGLSTRLVR